MTPIPLNIVIPGRTKCSGESRIRVWSFRIPGMTSSTISIMIAKSKSKSPPAVATLTKAQAKVELKRLALEIERHDKALLSGRRAENFGRRI